MTTTRTMAKAMGRRGGQARARRLSPEERRRIAALGGAARRASLAAARRIEENFSYLETVQALGPRGRRPARVSTCRGPLPGIYPQRG